nr:hypothetical protein [Tanacetum cinerariifolium]
MSDSKDSTVTYTAVSSPFRGLSDIGSSGVDGPSVMPKDPYAYVVAAFQAPPSPYYVSGLEYLPSPNHWLLLSVDSPGYVLESDSEEEPKEDPEEDTTDYPSDGGDDDDDESSNDDEEDDDDVEEDEDEEEEEEHLAPADSTTVALPAIDHAPSAEETGPFETDESAATPPPHPAYHVTTRMLSSYDDLAKSEASSTSLPLLLPSTYHLTPPSGTPPLLPIPLPTLSPPLLPPSTDPRADVREVCLPPQKKLCYAFGLRLEVGESSSAPTVRPARDSRLDYGFITTLVDEIIRDLERDVSAKRLEIAALRAADRTRQGQFTKALRLLLRLQTQMTEFERQ